MMMMMMMMMLLVVHIADNELRYIVRVHSTPGLKTEIGYKGRK